jgi:hypothetical protein
MATQDKPELAQEFANTLAAIRPDIAQAVARVISNPITALICRASMYLL